MTEPQSYPLHRLSASAPDNPRISEDSVINNDVPNNLFSGESPNNVASHSTHPNDQASADSLLSASQRNSFYVNVFTNGWGWEIAAWVLVAISVVALLIIFARYTNKSLRQWDLAVTPGAVVAVLSQIGHTAAVVPVTACVCQSMWLSLAKKSGLAQRTEQVDRPSRLIQVQKYFDGSRGPLGSISLLYEHPRSYEKPTLFICAALTESRMLVWLGAINLILIILFGPFAQQTLQLPTRSYNTLDPASLPRCLQYRASQPSVQLSTPPGDPSRQYNSVPVAMRLAVADGLSRNDVSPSNIQGSCPTRNCTWGSYQTLGVCSNVEDVSSSITSKCRKTPINLAGCKYSVPEISKHPTLTDTQLDIPRRGLGHTLWVGASDYHLQNNPYSNINTLVEFYVIYVQDFAKWDSLDPTIDHKDDLIALKGVLNLCLYEYNTSTVSGVTETTELSKNTGQNWEVGVAAEDDSQTQFPTVTTTSDAETFWMKTDNMNSFREFLAYEIFVGYASMRSKAKAPSGGGNGSDNANVNAIVASVYGDTTGVQGLSKMLNNLTISMGNA